MAEITDEQFHELINRAFDSLPLSHRDQVQNVAIVTADEPTPQQREALRLRGDQTLLGLYEGVPLTARQGRPADYPPDVITLFKRPLLAQSHNERDLQEHIRHTLWHEVAHYFGLNHDDIHRREA